jgi:hypothetical protein
MEYESETWSANESSAQRQQKLGVLGTIVLLAVDPERALLQGFRDPHRIWGHVRQAKAATDTMMFSRRV